MAGYDRPGLLRFRRPDLSAQALHLPGPAPGSRVGWATVAAACGLLIGITASVTTTGAVVLAVALFLALAAGTRPAVVAALVAVFALISEILPTGVVLLFLGVAVLELASGRSRIAVSPPLVWAGAFTLWALASALWTVDLGMAFQQFLGLVFAASFLIAAAGLVGNQADALLVFRAYAAAAVVTGAISIVTFDPEVALRQVGEQIDPNTVTGDPNIFAMYQVVAVPILLMLSAHAPSRWERTLAYVGLPVAVAATLASLSRGGALALGAVALALILVPAGQLYRSRRHKATVVALMLAVAGLSGVVLSDQFSARLSNEETAAGSGRVNEWRSAGAAFLDQPVIGLGFGGYYAASNDLLRRTPGVDLARFRLTKPGVRVHSAYIGVAAELGMVGFVAFGGLLIATALSLRRTARRALTRGRPLVAHMSTSLLVGLAGFAVASLFLSTEGSLLTFTIIGVAVALHKLAEGPEGVAAS